MKRRLAILALFLILIFVLGIGLGIFFRQLSGIGSTGKVYNTATLLREVQGLSQLVTVKYVMEKVVILEVPPGSTLGKMFAGESRVLMLAHGIVKGGIDLGRLQPVDLEVHDKKIRIRLR